MLNRHVFCKIEYVVHRFNSNVLLRSKQPGAVLRNPYRRQHPCEGLSLPILVMQFKLPIWQQSSASNMPAVSKDIFAATVIVKLSTVIVEQNPGKTRPIGFNEILDVVVCLSAGSAWRLAFVGRPKCVTNMAVAGNKGHSACINLYKLHFGGAEKWMRSALPKTHPGRANTPVRPLIRP